MQNVRLLMAACGLALSVLLIAGNAFAYAPEDQLLETKGYSPSLIDTISKQRSRQEWREPSAPRRTPMENALHNIYNNDWTGSFDEFGSRIIREN